MISLKQIKEAYPLHLQGFESFILREYLQYKILELLFQSDFSGKFAFLGGTCLRIIHDNTRFSEDLDFDNFGLTEDDFEEVSKHIENGLESEGYEVEIRNVYKGAFHCYIKFPGLLFDAGISGHKQAKILINLDTEPQDFDFKPIITILNKFDVFSPIPSTPADLLLSQKFTAITQRKRPKGRDFFDVVFLLSKGVKPNYDFLKMKLNIEHSEQLRLHLTKLCKTFDFEALAVDVQPFLFFQKDLQKVKFFETYIPSMKL